VKQTIGAGGAGAVSAEAGAPAPALQRTRLGAARRRLAREGTPYLLIAPAIGVLVAVLGYPLYFLVRISFERYGLRELILLEGTWNGFANYTHLLGDAEFWRVMVRTLVFTAVNVALTMVLGTLIALLLERLGRTMQMVVTTGLVAAWALPPIVAVPIWQWMVDFEFGVLNWTLTALHVGDFDHHNWFEDPLQGFAVITALVVWGAIPFVAIVVYAGLTQLPRELVEAARVDGANAWHVFRHVTFPLLKPIFVIVTSLEIIWDFGVFNQVWVMLGERPTSDYYLIGVYSFVTSFKVSQYGLGAAIAVVMVLVLLAVSFVYIRQMVRLGEVR
jgi:N,N'-diacetylchitobiose transport system permease protein